jgi:hypothetical protein
MSYLSLWEIISFFCVCIPVANCMGGVLSSWILFYIVCSLRLYLTIYSIPVILSSPYSLDPHLLGLASTPGDASEACDWLGEQLSSQGVCQMRSLSCCVRAGESTCQPPGLLDARPFLGKLSKVLRMYSR